MKKDQTFYCTSCGYKSVKWVGKCQSCGQWNTFSKYENEIANLPKDKKKIYKLDNVESSFRENQFYKTGLLEFDKIFGNGLVVGSFNLIAGEPGVGKSTFLLNLIDLILQKNECKIIYLSGEESINQISNRCKRLKIKSSNFYISNALTIESIVEIIQENEPQILVIDSIQTIKFDEQNLNSLTTSNLREIALKIIEITKLKNITVIAIGHITKDGNVAGPKVIEHMVDSVILFENDNATNNRIVRSSKNRFGKTNEICALALEEEGFKIIDYASTLFHGKRSINNFGYSLSCITLGSRSLVVENQGLVVHNKYANGKRYTQGIDFGRLNLLVAIIEKYLDLELSHYDIYINISGGLNIHNREIDLSIIGSILGSYFNRTVKEDPLFLGEVGLDGNIKPVSNLSQIINEAKRIGIKSIYGSRYQDGIEKVGINEISFRGFESIKELKDRFFQ